MRRPPRPGVFALLTLMGITTLAIACGDVPTFGDGIATYTPVQLPLPAVALGDTLRDSLGVATPLRVRAFTRDSQEVTGFPVFFLPSSLPSLVRVDSATGYVVANDTATGTAQVVGRIGDRLQTTVATLLVVPEPTTIARSDDVAGDTALSLPALRDLPVTVTGTYKGASTAVNGIIVRYRIDSLVPSTLAPGSAILVNDATVPLRPDSTIAVDTTATNGAAMRKLLVAGSGVRRVYVSATVRRLRDAAPLAPVRFVVDIKP